MKHAAINVTLIILFFLAASLAAHFSKSLSGLRGLGRNNKFKGA